MKAGHKFALAFINIAGVAALLIWASRAISLHQVSLAFEAMPKTGLISAFGLNFALLVLYGLRMSMLIGTPFAPALATVWLGFGLNSMLPLRLGDLAKLVYARQLFDISTSRLTAASALEKLFDLSAVLLLGLTVTRFVSISAIQAGMISLAGLLTVGIAGLVAALALQRRWRPAKQRVFQWIGAVMHSVSGQLRGRQPIVVGLYTVAIWGVTVVTAYAMFASIHPDFGWTDACLLTLILVLAVSVPGAPAGLGIVEAGIVGYLHTVLKVDAAEAFAAAFAFHLASAFPQMLGAAGILVWAALHNRLRQERG